jgi:hypothetical protein
MRLAVFLLLFAGLGFSQTAKVIQLTVDDAVAAADLAKQERELQLKRAEFDARIKRKYLTVRSSDFRSGSCSAGREGEGDGLILSGTSNLYVISDGAHGWTTGRGPGHCETEAERHAREADEIAMRKVQAEYERSTPRYHTEAAGAAASSSIARTTCTSPRFPLRW